MNNLFSLKRTCSPSEDKNSFSKSFGRKCFGFFFACFPKISLLILGAFLLEGSLVLASFEEEEIKQPKTNVEEFIREYQIGPESISAFPSGQTGEDIYQEKNVKTLERKNNVLWDPIFFLYAGQRIDFSRSIFSFEGLVQSGHSVLLVGGGQKKEDLQIIAIYKPDGNGIKIAHLTVPSWQGDRKSKIFFKHFPSQRADSPISGNFNNKPENLSWSFRGTAKHVLIENDRIQITGWRGFYQGRNVSDSHEPSLQLLGSSLSYDPENLPERLTRVEKGMISIPIKKTSEFHVKDFKELREHFLRKPRAIIGAQKISWPRNAPFSFSLPVSQEVYDDRDGYSSSYKRPSPELFPGDERNVSSKKEKDKKDSFVEGLKTFGVGGYIQGERKEQERLLLWSEDSLAPFKKNEKPYREIVTSIKTLK